MRARLATRAGGLAAVGSAVGAVALALWLSGSSIAAAPVADSGIAAASPHPDFNGDGYGDLGLGVPYEDVGSVVDAGGVTVIYGSPTGLTAAGNQFWTQNSAGVADVAQAGDQFGVGLAWGDFDGDGFDDLAVGARGEDVNDVPDAGAVNVLYGSAAGLTAAGNQFWSQDSPGIQDAPEEGDWFGYPLTSGDFDHDGFADLAIAVYRENLGFAGDAGGVHVLYGSAAGLASNRTQLWSQDSPGVLDQAETRDWFGRRLTAADWNGDGFADLAVSARMEDVGGVVDAGAVNVLYGSAAGVTAAGNQLWHQDSPNVRDVAEEGDNFGSSFAWGDFNGDSFNDLAMGVYLEDLGSAVNAGAVNVLYGSSAGLSAAGNQFWHQNSPGITDVAETEDRAGDGLGQGDFNGDGFDDLVLGVLREDVGSEVDAGAFNVFYGSAAGLSAAGNQYWDQNSPGVLDVAEAGDEFGDKMPGVDFNGDGITDFGSAARLDDVGAAVDAGVVNVFYGTASSGLSAAGDQLWHQDSAGIRDSAETGDNLGWNVAAF